MAEIAPSTPDAYDLGQLFVDQPEWFARETVPHTLAWLTAEYQWVARDLPEHFPAIPAQTEPDGLRRLASVVRRRPA